MKIAQPSVDLIDYLGSDLSVVNSARVSFGKHIDKVDETDIKLISYLAKHNHWSPFAHTSLQFRISAPIFVARQLVKHQVGGVWNEVSRRYVDDEPSFYFPTSFRGKPVNAKQGSSDITIAVDSTDLYTLEGDAYHLHDHVDLVKYMLEWYNNAIKHGVAPEQARMFLPQNTMTEWYWTGSLAFFARVCKQRLDPHAQQETREIAQMINDKIPTEFEHSWKALMFG